MSDLIEKLKAATEEDQDRLLTIAFNKLQASGRISRELSAKAYKMLQVEAYESAALLLVPEGAPAELRFHRDAVTGDDYASYRIIPNKWQTHRTPALAICAAALEAKEKANE